MANIFAILTALVLAVSGYLAYANMGDENIAKRGYKGWIKARTDEQASLKRNQNTLAGLQKDLKDTEGELADYNSQNETLQTEVEAQLAKNSELEAQVSAKKAEAESKAAEVAEKQKVIEGIGDADQVIATLKRTQDQLQELGRAIDEGTAKRAALEAEKKNTEVAMEGLKGTINLRVSGKSDPSLRTYVRSVYRGLGFVTLAAGDNKGIVKDSRLDVIRDGEKVGQLQVTTVEANTAAADIVPDSLIPGGSIVEGDIVIAEQPKEKAPKK
jgi:seryl-tRNA synthetase